MALVSIERYLLIFHRPFLTRYHLFLSIIPMMIFIIYPIIWYITMIYSSYFCTYKPDYSVMQCGAPCALITSKFYLLFIIYGHHLLPVFTTTFANLYLIITVVYQKAKMKRNNSWRRNFQMMSQLLSVAVFYLIIWLPHCILATFPLFTIGETATRARLMYSEYFENFLSIFVCFCPFIILIGLPQLHNQIRHTIKTVQGFCCPWCNTHVAVAPSTTN